ncbi:MAG: hypothetical protein H6Q76_2070, partial [Firmicutes bacterium]|nr:hypothetical protein [Bacillota bacterium]
MPDQTPGSRLGKLLQTQSPVFFLLLLAFCLTIVGAAWYEVNTRIDREYRIERDAVYLEGSNLARSFEDHIQRSLREVDDTLLSIKFSYEALNHLSQQRVDPEIASYMQKRRSLLLERVFLLDVDGNVL